MSRLTLAGVDITPVFDSVMGLIGDSSRVCRNVSQEGRVISTLENARFSQPFSLVRNRTPHLDNKFDWIGC